MEPAAQSLIHGESGRIGHLKALVRWRFKNAFDAGREDRGASEPVTTGVSA